MARRLEIWTARAPVALGAVAVFLFAFASPGLAGSGGTAVAIPRAVLPAPGLGEAPSALLAVRGPAPRLQVAENHGAADESPGFVLAAVEIEGVTAYGPEELRPYYRDLLGQEITLDAVFAVAEAITARYRNDGYALSQAIVPPQTISDGKVRLTVVEGFIDRVLVEGDPRGRAELFRDWGEKIKAARPFQVAILERYSLLANDLPGAQVRAVLRASEETPGAADLIFEVKHQIVEAAANLDNRVSRTTGQAQALVSVSGNSVFGRYERTSFTYSRAKVRDRSQFVGIRHDQVLNSEGIALSLAASYSASQPGDVLKDLNLLSKSKTLNAEMTYPAIRSRDANLILSAGFTYRKVDSDAASARLFRDRLSVVSFGASADFIDPWNGSNTVALRVYKGISAFNGSVEGDEFLTRDDGSGIFSKIAGSLSRTQYLADGLSIYMAATGQLASRALLSSEEFAYGGAGFGRAYDPSEITGDHGAAVVAELRYTNQTDFDFVDYYQVYGYWDLGTTYDIGTGGSDAKRSGASLGLGLRFGVNDYLSGQIELAKPTTRTVALANNGKAARVFFRLSARF